MLTVSNPVDILTQYAVELSGLPEGQVIGSGTVLDTARLKQALGHVLDVDPRAVHARIVGEHGDSEIALWSSANVAGIPLTDYFNVRGINAPEAEMTRIADEVKNSAYEIIEKKRATYYGIAASVRRICSVIMRNEKTILTVSHPLDAGYGVEGVCLSMPAVVGKCGVIARVPAPLNWSERTQLLQSAATLKHVYEAARSELNEESKPE